MADERTDFEKLIDGINELAVGISKYHHGLIESGISEQDALELTLQYQHEIFEVMRAIQGRQNDQHG